MKTVVTSLAIMFVVLGAKQAACDDASLRQALVQSCEQEKNKDYAKAVAVLTAQDAANKGNYVLNLRLGWLQYLDHKNAESERYYRAAIESSPKSIEAKLGCLLPLLAASKHKEAETLARQILKEDPRNYYANLRLVTALRFAEKSG